VANDIRTGIATIPKLITPFQKAFGMFNSFNKDKKMSGKTRALF
jgi:hypothetical protein